MDFVEVELRLHARLANLQEQLRKRLTAIEPQHDSPMFQGESSPTWQSKDVGVTRSQRTQGRPQAQKHRQPQHQSKQQRQPPPQPQWQLPQQPQQPQQQQQQQCGPQVLPHWQQQQQQQAQHQPPSRPLGVWHSAQQQQPRQQVTSKATSLAVDFSLLSSSPTFSPTAQRRKCATDSSSECATETDISSNDYGQTCCPSSCPDGSAEASFSRQTSPGTMAPCPSQDFGMSEVATDNQFGDDDGFDAPSLVFPPTPDGTPLSSPRFYGANTVDSLPVMYARGNTADSLPTMYALPQLSFF